MKKMWKDRQFEQAKQNDIRQYLQNEVIEALKETKKSVMVKLMNIRWVVTVKHFLEKKVQGEVSDTRAIKKATHMQTPCQTMFPPSGCTTFRTIEADVSRTLNDLADDWDHNKKTKKHIDR